MRVQTLNFYKGDLNFSAGHFTIFSATEREHMHGHNFYLEASVTAAVDKSGITFDYRIFKRKLAGLCANLHTYFLLPEFSPYLKIAIEGDYLYAEFNQKKIPFLREDVVLLPIANITLEELSRWFLQQMLADEQFIKEYGISAMEIRVFNGLEQSAAASWEV